MGAIVAAIAFDSFHEIDEGGPPASKWRSSRGSSLSDVAAKLGFADIIVFGSSETGTGKRGLHSALENVYEAVVAALYLDGGIDAAVKFVRRTLIPHMSLDRPRSPKTPRAPFRRSCRRAASRRLTS